ncbi:hypothetical protein PG995_015120 [Apiospora arundinis]
MYNAVAHGNSERTKTQVTCTLGTGRHDGDDGSDGLFERVYPEVTMLDYKMTQKVMIMKKLPSSIITIR